MLYIRLRQNTIMWALLIALYSASGVLILFAPEVVSLIAITVASAVAGVTLWLDRSDIRSELELELEGQGDAQEFDDDRYVQTERGLAEQALAAAHRRTREERNRIAAIRDQGKYGRRAYGSADTVPQDDDACEVARDSGGRTPRASGPPMQNLPPKPTSGGSILDRLISPGGVSRDALIDFKADIERGRAERVAARLQSDMRAALSTQLAARSLGSDVDVLQFDNDVDPDIAEAAKAMGVNLMPRIHDDVIVDLTGAGIILAEDFPPDGLQRPDENDVDPGRLPVSTGLAALSRKFYAQLDASDAETSRRLGQFDQAKYDRLCAEKHERQADDRMLQAQTLDGTAAERLLWASSQAELDKAVAAAQAKSDEQTAEFRAGGLGGSKSAEVDDIVRVARVNLLDVVQAQTLDGTATERFLLWAEQTVEDHGGSKSAEADELAATQHRTAYDELATAEQEYRAARQAMAEFVKDPDAATARSTEDTARHEAGSPAGGSGGSLEDADSGGV